MSFAGFTEVDLSRFEDCKRSLEKPKPLKSKSAKMAKNSNIMKSSFKTVTLHPIESDIPPEALLNQNPTEEAAVEKKNNPEVTNEEINLLEDNENPESFEDIEEKNKRMKAFLATALNQRKEKTHQEVEKLKSIQGELVKLDEIVGQDVKIIRKDIEAVTWQLSEAKKRFDRAEREYINAKMTYHGLEERKDNLTDYLCHIIRENESRKSAKLHQIMEELGL